MADPRRRQWPVPAGCMIDGASIPQPFWTFVGGPYEGKYRDASAIHDWYCDVRTRTWPETHKVFYDGMVTRKVAPSRAKLMYLAVRAGGPRWFVGSGDATRKCDIQSLHNTSLTWTDDGGWDTGGGGGGTGLENPEGPGAGASGQDGQSHPSAGNASPSVAASEVSRLTQLQLPQPPDEEAAFAACLHVLRRTVFDTVYSLPYSTTWAQLIRNLDFRMRRQPRYYIQHRLAARGLILATERRLKHLSVLEIETLADTARSSGYQPPSRRSSSNPRDRDPGRAARLVRL